MTTPTGKRKEPIEDSPVKKSGKKPKQVRCITCNKDVGEEAVLCQWCNKWEHRVCADINTSEYKILTNSSKKIMFFCSRCHLKVPLALKLEDKDASLSSDYEALRKAIDDVAIKIDKLSSSESDLQRHITTAGQQLLNVSNSPSSVATNIVKELEDKERRKNNLIFYNVPEPPTPSWKADSDFVVNLCKATYDFEIQVVKAFRLGKKTTNKCRPLLIRLNDDELKSKILTKSYLLRSISPYEEIYISTDKTKAEQAKHKLLVEELKARRAKGEANIIIRGDSIIAKPNLPRQSHTLTTTKEIPKPMESS